MIWQNTLIDPRMRLARGDTNEDIQNEIRRKRPLFEAASAIVVSTRAERQRLNMEYSFSSGKVYTIPFFLPDIIAVPSSSLIKHDRPARVQILFVGNPARLKRLPLLLEALELLPTSVRQRLELAIVSRFSDGAVPIHGSFPIRVLGGLPHSEVQKEMRRAHILVNPSSYETFGFVFLEAQAAGAVAVGPSWEAQNEIFDGGRCGVMLRPEVTPQQLSSILADLICNDDERRALASNALTNYHRTYDSKLVGQQLISLITQVAKV
ncbi:glycosyltransferase [Arthrobacter sp. MPF02]|uniref:glycosyltransferase n=1 Tax=Arthrobacter sp. MPF02 TaxID=3388492 RepID=UPI003984DBA1